MLKLLLNTYCFLKYHSAQDWHYVKLTTLLIPDKKDYPDLPRQHFVEVGHRRPLYSGTWWMNEWSTLRMFSKSKIGFKAWNRRLCCKNNIFNRHLGILVSEPKNGNAKFCFGNGTNRFFFDKNSSSPLRPRKKNCQRIFFSAQTRNFKGKICSNSALAVEFFGQQDLNYLYWPIALKQLNFSYPHLIVVSL